MSNTEINTGNFTKFSLEELRKKQNHLKTDQFAKAPITEKEREYWSKINEVSEKESSFDAILSKAVKSVKRQQFQVPQSKLSFEAGKKITWQIVKTMLAQQNRALVIDESNKEIIPNLIKYFLGIEGAYDLKKGIYIFGNVGRGKTLLTRAMLALVNAANFECRKFQNVSVKKLMFEVSETSSIQPLKKYLSKPYCFDDFGFEDSSFKLYGNDMPIMEYVISMRYDKFIRSGLTTHITTNVPPDKLEKIYGDRISSRCLEMFNYVYLGGQDKRK